MIVGEVAAGQVPAATGENPAAGVDPADANAPGAPPAAGEQQSQLAGGTLAGSSRSTRSMRWVLGDTERTETQSLKNIYCPHQGLSGVLGLQSVPPVPVHSEDGVIVSLEPPADGSHQLEPPLDGSHQLWPVTVGNSATIMGVQSSVRGDAAEHAAEGLSDSMQYAAAAPAAQEATPVVRDASTRQRKTLWVEEVKAAHNLQQVWLGYWWLGYCLGYWLGHWLWYWVGYYWLGCWLGYCL